MGWEAWFTLTVVAVTVVVLARDLATPAVAVLGATALLFVVGVVDTQQAFAGFSNPAPLTVAALYVLARGVEVTGALQPVVDGMLGRGRTDDEQHWPRRWLLARLLAPTAATSAFLNNTPVIAMLAPQISDWADKRGLSSSPLLIPLSYAAIVGGLCTAVGTSTNLIISGLLEESGQAPLGMFEITAVGAPIAAACITAASLLAGRLLPDRRSAAQALRSPAREFTVTMRVLDEGPLTGKGVADAGLRDLQGVYLVQIRREGRVIAPVAPDEPLHAGDLLTFVGDVGLIVDLHRTRGLASTEHAHLGALGGSEDRRLTFFEAVVGEHSPLHGRTLKSVGFRDHYQAAVVAIHRSGETVDAKLGQVPLRVGDTLLILADEGFARRWRDSRDFLLIARLGGSPPAMTRKAPLVGLIGAGLVLTAAFGLLTILQAALVAAGLLVATKVLTPRQARDAVDLNIIIVIAAAFGIGAAMQTTGLAELIATGLVDVFSILGALGALLGVMLATIALTELVTNNAAAVLMFPVAQAAAATTGANPRGFAIAVAIAASASFLTPIGYQTNTMVYGLGGYRFTDFTRLGTPMTLLVMGISLTVIPTAWPL